MLSAVLVDLAFPTKRCGGGHRLPPCLGPGHLPGSVPPRGTYPRLKRPCISPTSTFPGTQGMLNLLTDQVSIKENVGRPKISMSNWLWFVLVQKDQCWAYLRNNTDVNVPRQSSCYSIRRCYMQSYIQRCMYFKVYSNASIRRSTLRYSHATAAVRSTVIFIHIFRWLCSQLVQYPNKIISNLVWFPIKMWYKNSKIGRHILTAVVAESNARHMHRFEKSFDISLAWPW